MSREDLKEIIHYLINSCVKLKDKYVDQDLIVDWICIFSQSDQEYEDLNRLASQIGEVVESTPSGPIYRFYNRPQTKAGQPYLLKIRVSDPTRPERGDVDFNTNYLEFKSRYLDNKNFKLIVRKDFEMIELMDPEFDVRVYFSSKPLSKQLKVS